MRTSLYRFFDANGGLLYVGITSRGANRFIEHAHDKGWWRHVATSTVTHFPSREEAVQAETNAIRDEKPRFNSTHSGQHRPSRARRESTNLLTREVVAKMLGISIGTLDRIVKRGDIAVVRVTSRSVRFLPADVNAYLESRRSGGGDSPIPTTRRRPFPGRSVVPIARVADLPQPSQKGKVVHLWDVPDPLKGAKR